MWSEASVGAEGGLLSAKEVYTPDYAQHLLERLQEFRDEMLFCDFTLEVENQSFKVIL